MNPKANKKKVVRILLYIVLSIAVFAVSLLVLPLELFLLSSVVVLVTLRGIEKELEEGEKKNISSLSGN